MISPGPGTPDDTGYCVDYLMTIGTEIPTLGVCLGHQTIVTAFGGEVGRRHEPRHGKVSIIDHDGRGVFTGLPDPFEATRYHSLAATSVPDLLEVTARSEDGVVQAVRHRDLPIEGVQFHPESIMTTVGRDLLANFLERRSPVASRQPEGSVGDVVGAGHRSLDQAFRHQVREGCFGVRCGNPVCGYDVLDRRCVPDQCPDDGTAKVTGRALKAALRRGGWYTAARNTSR